MEIRACDTPLALEHAALLGCYAQLLARWLLTERPLEIDPDFYLLYQYNRFEASRYGLDGEIALTRADGTSTETRLPLYADLLTRLHDLKRYAQSEADELALMRLRHMAYERINDAVWLRDAFKNGGSLNDLMRLSANLWMTLTASPYFH